MTMLKRWAKHQPCSAAKGGIQAYLEVRDGRERVVAKFTHELVGDTDRSEWAVAMDRTRAAAGHHRLPGDMEGEAVPGKDGRARRRRNVMAHHFMLSPDPGSGCGPEEVMALAQLWAGKHFGTGELMDSEPGALGNYQYVIELHDDGTNGVVHAHIVVNNTDVDTGRRLHIDDEANDRLWDSAQDISRELGMPYRAHAKEWRRAESKEAQRRKREQSLGRYMTKVERSIACDGSFSWKAAIANGARSAKLLAHDEDSFVSTMRLAGFAVERAAGGDFLYRHPSRPDRWCCTGYRLGRDFTREAVLRDVDDNRRRGDMSDDANRERVLAKAIAALDGIADPSNVAARTAHGTALADAAFVLQTNRAFGIGCPEHYGQAIARLESDAAALDAAGGQGDLLRRKAEQLRRARDIAAEGDYFVGGAAAGPWMAPARAEAEARAAASAGGYLGRGAAPSRATDERKPDGAVRDGDGRSR